MNYFPYNIQGDLSEYKTHTKLVPYFPGSKKNTKYYYKIVDKNLYRITIFFCKEAYYNNLFRNYCIKGDRFYTFFMKKFKIMVVEK